MADAIISYGPKIGLINNAAIGEDYYDQFRPFLRGFDALVQASVISTLATPPSSPNDGDAYIVQSGTGIWATHNNHIAVWSAQVTQAGTDVLTPGWDYYVPKAGWIVYDTSTSCWSFFNGTAWTEILELSSSEDVSLLSPGSISIGATVGVNIWAGSGGVGIANDEGWGMVLQNNHGFMTIDQFGDGGLIIDNNAGGFTFDNEGGMTIANESGDITIDNDAGGFTFDNANGITVYNDAGGINLYTDAMLLVTNPNGESTADIGTINIIAQGSGGATPTGGEFQVNATGGYYFYQDGSPTNCSFNVYPYSYFYNQITTTAPIISGAPVGCLELSLGQTTLTSSQNINTTTTFADATTGALTLTLPDASVGMTSTYPVNPNSPSDPPFVLTLPAGWVQIIKKIDATSNTVTLVSANNNNPPFASLGQTFDGASTFVLAKQNDFVMLQSDGTNWRVIGGSHSTLTARTTSTTVVSTRTTYDATTAPIVATLPAAAAVQAGANYIIKKIDASVNAVTATPAGSDLIDGQTSYALSAQYKYVSLFSDGVSNWYIDGSN
jgi:hypothetical protein